MNIRVLGEQLESFEVGVLAQTVSVLGTSMDELLSGRGREPLVVVGRIFRQPSLASISSLIAHVTRLGVSVIVCPPFGDPELGQFLSTPLAVRVIRRPQQSGVTLAPMAEWGALNRSLSIRSDHVLETSLRTGILATDDGGGIVLLRYQASASHGAIFICTLQLLSYTSLTNELDRQQLLDAVLGWRENNEGTAGLATPVRTSPVSQESTCLVPTMLLVSSGSQFTPESIALALGTYFGIEPSPEEVNTAFVELRALGILAESEQQQWLNVNPNRLGELLQGRGLHAYARELRELVTSQGGGGL